LFQEWVAGAKRSTADSTPDRREIMEARLSRRNYRDRLLETYAPRAPKTMTVRNTPMKRRLVRSVALEATSKESIFASFCSPTFFHPYIVLKSSSIIANVW
jgi:hypothetical protein